MMKITVLTGAGISQESGIKTFRDANGLWENHPIEEVASPEGYARDQEMVQKFYNLRRAQLFEVEPNAAHKAFAKLEAHPEVKLTLVTQNVDDLHERGGSKNVLHMHGELRKIRHTQTGEVKYFEDELPQSDYLTWRPDIVWFGEAVKYPSEIENALVDTDLFLCIGTSSQVYPAAAFVNIVKQAGARCVELNLEKTSMSMQYHENIYGKAGEIVPQFVEELLAKL
jgi:NAD-dependent deacetylase